MPFIAAIRSSDLKDGPVVSDVNGWPIVIAWVENNLRAVINRCSHGQSAFLPEGKIRRRFILCPKHGARFNLEDGTCVGGAYHKLRTFPCREAGEWIEINVPDAPYEGA